MVRTTNFEGIEALLGKHGNARTGATEARHRGAGLTYDHHRAQGPASRLEAAGTAIRLSDSSWQCKMSSVYQSTPIVMAMSACHWRRVISAVVSQHIVCVGDAVKARAVR